jgi:hypothetical protein
MELLCSHADVLLTVALVIAELEDEPLTQSELTDLINECNHRLELRGILNLIQEWLDLEVLLREDDLYTIDPEVAIDLFHTTTSCLTEVQRSAWIRAQASN